MRGKAVPPGWGEGCAPGDSVQQVKQLVEQPRGQCKPRGSRRDEAARGGVRTEGGRDKAARPAAGTGVGGLGAGEPP